nr:MAG TPA: hypothetical protein [Caudoviricetes sp.]
MDCKQQLTTRNTPPGDPIPPAVLQWPIHVCNLIIPL